MSQINMTIDERITWAKKQRAVAYKKDSVQGIVFWDGYIAALEAVKEESRGAEEIFEAIRVEINLALESNYACKREHSDKDNPYIQNLMHLVDGKIAALRGIDDFLNELEEKRTNEQR